MILQNINTTPSIVEPAHPEMSTIDESLNIPHTDLYIQHEQSNVDETNKVYDNNR